MEKWRSVGFATFVCGLLLLVAVPFAAGQSPGMSRLQNDDPNNWPMYHRSYDSFRFSPLTRINKENVLASVIPDSCSRPSFTESSPPQGPSGGRCSIP